MKLLIVEDNPGVRKMIRNLVASVAREICECADGAGVLALFSRERPDFVLMDLLGFILPVFRCERLRWCLK